MIPPINIKADFRPAQRALIALRTKQVPFATALALTKLAKGVQAVEAQATIDTFDHPTPFTQNAFAIVPATKTKLAAIVYPKDVAAQYLAPYVVGGDRSLGGKRAMLVPIGAGVNAYGNLPRGTLARLKAKPNVFVGTVTFRKTGRSVSGVWQRNPTARGKRYKGDGEFGTRGNNQSVVGGVRSTLKLLIEFDKTSPAPKHLPFYERGRAYLRKNAAREWDAAMRQALRTARR